MNAPLKKIVAKGGPFIGLLVLSFAFKGPSAMGGTVPRSPPRTDTVAPETAAPLFDPIHPTNPRRYV